MLWRDLRARQGWRRPLATLLCGAATVVVPLGVLKCWLEVTEPLKMTHASAYIYTVKNLSQGNWGLFDFSRLFSRSLWNDQFDRWNETMMHPVLFLVLIVGGIVVLPKARWPAAGLFVFFLLTQLIFPFAYAWQDYYYYSCAVFVAGALGFVFLAVWDSNAPRWVGVALCLLIFAGNARSYWVTYWPQQSLVHPAKMDFTENLKNMTPPGSVLVIAGYDWAPMIPYYTERRALMIRNGLEYDPVYLRRAFHELQDETVSALIVAPGQRGNRPFLDQAIAALDLDPVPVFSCSVRGDVYVNRFNAEATLLWINASRNRFPTTVTFPPRLSSSRQLRLLSREQAAEDFPMVSPLPHESDFEYNYALASHRGHKVLMAHADSFIWVRPPAGAREITIEFGILDGAWQQENLKTDGVEFVIYGEIKVRGWRRVIFQRVLDPVAHEQDRAIMTATVKFTPMQGETLCFATLGHGSRIYDWAYWKSVEVR